jgi:heme exporter protein B
MMAAFGALFWRDMKLSARIGGGAAVGLVFFLMLVTIMPFAVGPDMALLARIGPAILWVAALLATLIGLDRLFQADEEDGSLDLLRMSPLPLPLVVLSKGLAHWVSTGLPLVLAAPVLGLLLALEPKALLAVTVTLLAGTPALTFIGAIGAALTAGMRRGGLILSVLVMPLMVPVLIFGISASAAALGGPIPFMTPFMILLALTLFALVSGTVAGSFALQNSDG